MRWAWLGAPGPAANQAQRLFESHGGYSQTEIVRMQSNKGKENGGHGAV